MHHRMSTLDLENIHFSVCTLFLLLLFLRLHRAASHLPRLMFTMPTRTPRCLIFLCRLIFPRHHAFPVPPRLHRVPPHLLRAHYFSPVPVLLFGATTTLTSAPLIFDAATTPRAPLRRRHNSAARAAPFGRRHNSAPLTPCHLATATLSA
jgi:hypothetical protein